MEMRKKRNRLQEIYVREAMCEGVFATWVSEQGAEGVLDTLGELLWWLDGIASCRWGCRGGDHEEEHLLGRISANASAALLLVRSGCRVDQHGDRPPVRDCSNDLLGPHRLGQWPSACRITSEH